MAQSGKAVTAISATTLITRKSIEKFADLDSQLADLNSTIADLNSEHMDLNSTIADLSSERVDLNSAIADLNSEYMDLDSASCSSLQPHVALPESALFRNTNGRTRNLFSRNRGGHGSSANVLQQLYRTVGHNQLVECS
ncbi:MAG: hypothetical protein KME13_14120 [Myxacorys californica WJT36-NPBG1]|jgi:hypothetical protein|nr:hypothetical protein [Myxacorys californica WJT36-NPBG1]